MGVTEGETCEGNNDRTLFCAHFSPSPSFTPFTFKCEYSELKCERSELKPERSHFYFERSRFEYIQLSRKDFLL